MSVRKDLAYSADNILEIGAVGRTALLRYAPQEMQVAWLHDFLHQRQKTRKTKGHLILSSDRLQARTLLDAALGAAVVSVAQNFAARGPLAESYLPIG